MSSILWTAVVRTGLSRWLTGGEWFVNAPPSPPARHVPPCAAALPLARTQGEFATTASPRTSTTRA